LAAGFEAYQNGRPTRLTWNDGTEFEVTFDDKQRIQRIEETNAQSTPLSLELTWQQRDHIRNELISRIVRSGPGFSETWDLTYDDANRRLIETLITRSNGQTIHETYGSTSNKLAPNLVRTLDGQVILDLQKVLDASSQNVRFASATDAANQIQTEWNYDEEGSLQSETLTHTQTGETYESTYSFDARRSLAEIERVNANGEVVLERYAYDLDQRRIRSSRGAGTSASTIYAYQGSQVIAIGTKDNGSIHWDYAIGRGPTGPAFIKDLSETGSSYYVFTDHLGTPFAWKEEGTGEITYTPFNPWGEILANDPVRGPPPYAKGNIQNEGFNLPNVPGFPGNLPPIGLAGHYYEHNTGLTYMHHRWYSPRLGTFLTPDFRPPNIYEPSTFTKPYAYAAGNPVMYWDLDGLKEKYAGNIDQTWSDKYEELNNSTFVQRLDILLTDRRVTFRTFVRTPYSYYLPR